LKIPKRQSESANRRRTDLKIPKRQSESANRRRTENTTAIRKRSNGQTTIYYTPHRKPKIEQHEYY